MESDAKRMCSDDLKLLLCRLDIGMVLSVPDSWLERAIPGSRVARLRLVEDIARQYHCVCRHDMDGLKFERLGFPFTG